MVLNDAEAMELSRPNECPITSVVEFRWAAYQAEVRKILLSLGLWNGSGSAWLAHEAAAPPKE